MRRTITQALRVSLGASVRVPVLMPTRRVARGSKISLGRSGEATVRPVAIDLLHGIRSDRRAVRNLAIDGDLTGRR